jgi:hypothetical protein
MRRKVEAKLAGTLECEMRGVPAHGVDHMRHRLEHIPGELTRRHGPVMLEEGLQRKPACGGRVEKMFRLHAHAGVLTFP